ncbi:DinB family protein [Aggregatilineales bacterium SYSU G02658]
MTRDELLTELAQRRAHTLQTLETIPLETVVYPESGWRVQDLLTHVTHWEEQCLLTLEHALRGERYFLPNFRELGLDGFNAANVEQHRQDTPEMTLARMASVRQQMIALVSQLTDEQWASTVRWLGQDATPAQMIAGILWHEDHHLGEIVQSISQRL